MNRKSKVETENKSQLTLKNVAEENGVFKRGAKYLATVLAVRKEGVAVVMPGGKGSGTVTACCWGKGVYRDAALEKLVAGDELEVVVKSYDARSQNLSLVLKGYEHLLRCAVKPCVRKQGKTGKMAPAMNARVGGSAVRPIDKVKKSNYRLIPGGTTMLVDTANLLGAIGPQHAAHRLSVIESALSELGHKVFFFIENRAMGWARYNQDTPEEADALEAFCSRSNVSKVGGEADLPILQAASAIADSVILTRDHYEEYGDVFPEIVGSDRICSCSSVTVDDKTLLSIVGLRDAIVIDGELQSPIENVAGDGNNVQVTEPAETAGTMAVRPTRKGLLGVGDILREKGAFAKALACYGRIAKKNPEAYYDMSDIYADCESGIGDARVSLKYHRLGQKSERKLRQCKLRRARLRAEGRRTGHNVRGLMRAA